MKIFNRTLLLYLSFVFILFMKNILFDYATFHSLIISSLWKSPVTFFLYYFGKLIPALFIGSFIFLSKNKIWTIIVLALIDIWMVSNSIYRAANELFLDVDSILMVTNLQGFGQSISTYLDIWTFIPIFTTFIYTILLFLIKGVNVDIPVNNKKIFAFTFLFAVLIQVLCDVTTYVPKLQNKEAQFARNNDSNFIINSLYHFIPFRSMYYNVDIWGYEDYISDYIHQKSIVHYFPSVIYSYIGRNLNKTPTVNANEIIPYTRPAYGIKFTPNHSLLIIIVESLESWVINAKDLNGRLIAPNLSSLVNSDTSIYFSKVKSQVKSGVSGDGQMIINTGLLPISRGAACMRFDENIFPNIAHAFSNSLIIHPCDNNVWNQKTMTNKYEYKNEIAPANGGGYWNDGQLFANLINIVDTIASPFCIQAITISMHSPFNLQNNNYDFSLPDGTPKLLEDYLDCVHYTDSCLGIFLQECESKQLDNMHLVVTGDHTVFKDDLLETFQYLNENLRWEIPRRFSYCPLIIRSPEINTNRRVDNLVYQMDIYPTIQSLIGDTTYVWKGLGENLLESTNTNNRKVDESYLYQLSNRIIHNNTLAPYFHK